MVAKMTAKGGNVNAFHLPQAGLFEQLQGIEVVAEDEGLIKTKGGVGVLVVRWVFVFHGACFCLGCDQCA